MGDTPGTRRGLAPEPPWRIADTRSQCDEGAGQGSTCAVRPTHTALAGARDPANLTSMGIKYVPLNDRLYGYLSALRSDADDPLLRELRVETAALGEEVAKCQVSDDQGTFLSLLTAAIGARSAIEVGTFTGYSSICIARGLAAGGKLLCLDANQEWTTIARKYWAKAGLEDRIDSGSARPSQHSGSWSRAGRLIWRS